MRIWEPISKADMRSADMGTDKQSGYVGCGLGVMICRNKKKGVLNLSAQDP